MKKESLQEKGNEGMKEYDCYLFDGDGTLFDTIDLICECFHHVAETLFQKTLQRESVIEGIGAPLVSILQQQLGNEINVPHVLKVYQDHQDTILAQRVKLFPEVKETLEGLKCQQKKLGIVTSRRRPSLETILRATGIEQYFDVLITPEDTSSHKPHPAPVLKALSVLDMPKENTLFVGDAHYDINSGNGAGVDTAFVSWSHTLPETLPEQPTWILDSACQLCSVKEVCP